MNKLHGHARRPVDLPVNRLDGLLLEPGKVPPSLLVAHAQFDSQRGKHLAKLVQFVDFDPLVPIRVVGHHPVSKVEVRLERKIC